MEQTNINDPVVVFNDGSRARKIANIFLVFGIISVIYTLYIILARPFSLWETYITELFYPRGVHNQIAFIPFILEIVLFCFTLLLSFLPYYISRKYYIYRNNHYVRQIFLGIITVFLSQVLIFVCFTLVIPQDRSAYRYNYKPDIIPCVPRPGVFCPN